jgi:hypothetical protein
MNRLFISIVSGIALVLGLSNSAYAQGSPINLNAGFIAQTAANNGGNPLNYIGTSLTGMAGNTQITGTITGPSGNLAVSGTNLSNTYGYSANFGVMTITYTFTFSFSCNKAGQIFCTYTITQLGQGPQNGVVNTGRNTVETGNTNGPASTTTGVGTTSGPYMDPAPFNPIIFSNPFLFITQLPAPPPGYIFYGPYIYLPQTAN